MEFNTKELKEILELIDGTEVGAKIRISSYFRNRINEQELIKLFISLGDRVINTTIDMEGDRKLDVTLRLVAKTKGDDTEDDI